MIKNLKLLYLFLYFVSISVLHVYGTASVGLLGRITLSDLLLLPILLVVFIKLCFRRIYIEKGILILISLWIVSMFLSVVFSSRVEKSFLELIVHIFCLLHGLHLLFLLTPVSDAWKVKVWKLWVLSGGAVAVINLVIYFFLPQLNDSETGALVGTFRNYGQAGNYLSIAIVSSIISLRAMKLGKFNRIVIVVLILELIALLLTIKRSALIGVGSAVSFYIFYDIFFIRFSVKKIITTFVTVSLVLLTYLIFQYGMSVNEQFALRFQQRIVSDSGRQVATNFIVSNYSSALNAFYDRPILGAGLGGVMGVYTAKYEIHGTPMKILATGGILGSLTYVILMFGIFVRLFYARSNIIIDMKIPVVLILGLSVSFIYNYHVRKREFWILIFLLFLLANLRVSRSKSTKELH